MKDKTSINLSVAILALLIAGCLPQASAAQEPGDRFRDQFIRHFDHASTRFLSLARTMPEEYYSWRPGEGVMSFAEVCMHIASYNYRLPVQNLGYPAPEGMDPDQMESISGKQEVLAEMERSVEFVRTVIEEIPDSGFDEPARLFGREVTVQAVLLMLITHKSEHLGQSVAYARMNGIVPPWSR